MIARSSADLRGREREFGLANLRFLSIDGGHTRRLTLNDLRIADACLTDGRPLLPGRRVQRALAGRGLRPVRVPAVRTRAGPGRPIPEQAVPQPPGPQAVLRRTRSAGCSPKRSNGSGWSCTGPRSTCSATSGRRLAARCGRSRAGLPRPTSRRRARPGPRPGRPRPRQRRPPPKRGRRRRKPCGTFRRRPRRAGRAQACRSASPAALGSRLGGALRAWPVAAARLSRRRTRADHARAGARRARRCRGRGLRRALVPRHLPRRRGGGRGGLFAFRPRALPGARSGGGTPPVCQRSRRGGPLGGRRDRRTEDQRRLVRRRRAARRGAAAGTGWRTRWSWRASTR